MMEPTEQRINILVVVESNFINLCRDPQVYVSDFKDKVVAKSHNRASLFTVTGKYGLTNVDKTIPAIEVMDKNKTMFRQMLENSSTMFDEVVVLTSVPDDPYIESVREVATNTSKTFTRYGYPLKRKDEHGQQESI